MNHIEEARYEIEEYTKKIQIEGRVLGDIATNTLFNSYTKNTLIENVSGLKTFGAEFEKSQKNKSFD
jgi:glutamine synthetase